MKRLIFLLLFLLSCSQRGTDEASRFQRLTLPAEVKVDFAMLKSELLTPHCIQCHNNTQLGDFNTEQGLFKYVLPNRPLESSLYLAVQSGRMPKGYTLHSSYLDMISAYINGIENKRPDTPVVPQDPILEPTYASLKFHLIDKSCIGCHNAKSARGGVVLESAKDLIDQIDSVLFQLELEMMPPSDSKIPLVEAPVIETLKQWQTNDFPL